MAEDTPFIFSRVLWAYRRQQNDCHRPRRLISSSENPQASMVDAPPILRANLWFVKKKEKKTKTTPKTTPKNDP